MNDAHPFIDYTNLPTPSEGIVVTTFITVRSIARSPAFYRDVLEGTVVLEENPCMVKLANSWIIMNPGGPPTPDKPDISVVNYEPGDTTSIFMNLRVADIDDCYRRWSERGHAIDAAHRHRRGDPPLHAGPRRLPDRGRPGDRTSLWAPGGRNAPRICQGSEQKRATARQEQRHPRFFIASVMHWPTAANRRTRRGVGTRMKTAPAAIPRARPRRRTGRRMA